MAYGTWFLQQKCAEERYRVRVQETLNELLPLAAGVLVPKGYSFGEDYEFFGYTSQEQAEFAYSALYAAAEGDRPVAAYRVGRLRPAHSHRSKDGGPSPPTRLCMQSSSGSRSGWSVRWWAPRLSSRARQDAPIRRASG